MRVIFSYWTGAESADRTVTPEMAAVSNFFAQKHGYKTTLFADELGVQRLSGVRYDTVERLPQNILNEFPKHGWSLGKLLAVSMVNEPFMHFDFDLFLYDPLRSEIIDADAVFLHSEPWMDAAMKNSCRMVKKYPTLVASPQQYRSYNCAIFGGKKYLEISTAAKNIYNFAMENAHLLDTLSAQQRELYDIGKTRFHMYLDMLLEQLWLPQILLSHGIDISTILQSPEILDIDMEDFSVMSIEEMFDGVSAEKAEKFKSLYFHLNTAARNAGIVHYYSRNKERHVDKIRALATKYNLSF